LIQSQPSRLAVFPRSKLAASLVARLMRSGRLVIEPLASASRTISTFNRGGRFDPTRSASVPLMLLRTSLAVAGSIAPPLSSPPKIWSTRESLGLMGDLGTAGDVGFEGESSANRYSLFRVSPNLIDNSSEEGDESSKKTLDSRIGVLAMRDREAFGVRICGGDCKDGIYGRFAGKPSPRKLSALLIVVKVGLVRFPRLACRTRLLWSLWSTEGLRLSPPVISSSSSDGVSPSPSSR
jgi:hypothetical protein